MNETKRRTSDEIDFAIDDGALTIAAEHTAERETGGDADEGIRHIHRERRSESVSRRIPIPGTVMEDEGSATYTNGVLAISLPRETDERFDDVKRIDVE